MHWITSKKLQSRPFLHFFGSNFRSSPQNPLRNHPKPTTNPLPATSSSFNARFPRAPATTLAPILPIPHPRARRLAMLERLRAAWVRRLGRWEWVRWMRKEERKRMVRDLGGIGWVLAELGGVMWLAWFMFFLKKHIWIQKDWKQKFFLDFGKNTWNSHFFGVWKTHFETRFFYGQNSHFSVSK
jgi:hypothetical protein